jgi:hypothetical protein
LLKNKRIRYFLVSLLVLGIITTIFITLFQTKPTVDDFGVWVEDRYDVKCENPSCQSFELMVKEKGKTKTETLRAMTEHTSEDWNSLTIERQYYDDTTKFSIYIKAKGILGKFRVIEEEKRLTYPH